MEEDIQEVSKKAFPVWLIVIIVIILLGILTALGWWLYKNQTEKENTSTSDGKDTNASSTADWQTYKSESMGFSIAIPPDWKQSESGTEGGVSFSGSQSSEGGAATLPMTFANIWSEANSANLTLQGVVDEFKNSIKLWPIKDFRVESEEDVTIDNEAGKKVVLSYSDLQTQTSTVSGLAFAIKNDKIWKINLIVTDKDAAAAMATWNENSYIFDKMISAFIFL